MPIRFTKVCCCVSILERSSITRMFSTTNPISSMDRAIDRAFKPLPYGVYLLQSKRRSSLQRPQECLLNEDIYGTPYKQYCSGSFDGWLIISEYAIGEDLRVGQYFFNPMTGARIMLPPFYTNNEFFVKAVASADPRYSDCMVAAITSHHKLFFCRPSDESWRYNCTLGFDHSDLQFDEDGRLYVSVIVSRILYAIFRFEPLKVLFEGADSASRVLCSKGKLRYSPDKRMMHPSLIRTSKGKLLVVQNQLVQMDENQDIAPFVVSELKPEERSYKSKLEDINDLGDEVIFLGDKEGGVSISISNLREREKALLGGGNRIVYMSAEDHKIVAYSLAERTFECPFASGFEVLQRCKPLWFTPNMSSFS